MTSAKKRRVRTWKGRAQEQAATPTAPAGPGIAHQPFHARLCLVGPLRRSTRSGYGPVRPAAPPVGLALHDVLGISRLGGWASHDGPADLGDGAARWTR